MPTTLQMFRFASLALQQVCQPCLAALKREHDANVGVPFAHGECGPVRARDIRHCPLEPSSTRAAASCELKSVDVQPGPGDG